MVVPGLAPPAFAPQSVRAAPTGIAFYLHPEVQRAARENCSQARVLKRMQEEGGGAQKGQRLANVAYSVPEEEIVSVCFAQPIAR